MPRPERKRTLRGTPPGPARSQWFVPKRPIDALLLFVPVAVLARLLGASPPLVFVFSAVGIIPLAGIMGHSTERLAERAGPGIGGLLNATFGNAAELIIAVIGLSRGLGEVVKASITGSIIGNCLLVLGLSALVGGLKYPVQRFNRTAASMGSTLMALAAIGMLVPTLFWYASGGASARHAASSGQLPRGLSLEIAIVLGTVYVLSLVFSLRTHKHLYAGDASPPAGIGGVLEGPSPFEASASEAPGGPGAAGASEAIHSADESVARKASRWSGGTSRHAGGGADPSLFVPVVLLLTSSAVVAVLAELLVGALEPTARALGLTDLFVGVIVVAIVGNAAEHASAVFAARKNQMDLALHIALGSSLQVALFVTPLLLGISYFIGPAPIDLHFTMFEVAAVILAVMGVNLVCQDGESNWMEGVLLLAVYAILGIAFYFLP